MEYPWKSSIVVQERQQLKTRVLGFVVLRRIEEGNETAELRWLGILGGSAAHTSADLVGHQRSGRNFS
jgi:hypothetical protein